MKQLIDYLGALQSTFEVARAFNRRKDLTFMLTKVTWAFYLNPPSTKREPGELNLSTCKDASPDLVLIELAVGHQGFGGPPVGVPIQVFKTALEQAITTCLETFDLNSVGVGDFDSSQGQIMVGFMINLEDQLEFTQATRVSEHDVIHRLTFSTKLKGRSKRKGRKNA